MYPKTIWYIMTEEEVIQQAGTKPDCKDCRFAESYFMNGSYDHYKCTHAGGEVCYYEVE